ncbi:MULTISPECIES: mechanosensitive ion channel family protein [unclassified Rhizobium]|uniref:mechanosensitive ion channel family protein n=1 Tax=unclassified Rhizobium TaxID=2613769 RepID=UPI0006F75BF2|nr:MULTISPECIES: mechanosensitive ion channel family protein [unclassified Rhizobium]KQV34637.1 mechanosensitive ion channel protein [Rhizobium sp. Root1212]KRD23971.1 mechanosensitive ion channel protein [Rhizobium sp. Root268]
MMSRFSILLAALLLAAPVLAQQPQQAQPTAQQPANGNAQAAAPAQSQPPAQDQATAQLDQATKDLKRLSAAVDGARDDDNRLADIKVEVDAVGKRIIATSVATRPRLDEIKARLAELGDPPAEGAPPEADVVTQERKRLTAERGAINALTGNAENLSIQATKLSNSITAIRRDLFSNALFKHTDISWGMFGDAVGSISAEYQALSRSIGSWLTFAWNYKRFALLSSIFLSLCAAFVLVSGTRRLFYPLIRNKADVSEPGYITRLTVAFWSTMVPTLVMVVFSASSYFFLNTFNVLRSDIAPLILVALGLGVVLVFVSQLARAVLSPREPAWRLVNVSDHGAALLFPAILAMAVVNGFDYFLATVSEVLSSPVVLTVARSFVATIVIGLILMAMALIRPMVPSPDEPQSRGKPWPRAISLSFVVTGGGLILAALSGYVGLGRFIATQIVITGAIFVTMYIGMLTGKAIAKQNALAGTIVGRYLERRFGMEQIALDQTGLAFGLGIYALVILFFVPLILLQWGFQIADIESWAYRFLTEIKIGSITISIVGIGAGILLFAIGYFVTRWFQRWLDGSVMARSRVDAGVRNSVKTGVGYLGVGLAGLVGISAAGLDLSNLALVAGALSLGVGFGLQNIVSNFVSGLILLVERPFKVGDWVVTGTTEGFVRRISVRATEIETFQRQTIMVPNSLFINASVGNWTHRNKLGRTDIPVVVGYDAAPRRIMDMLMEIAESHPLVLKTPSPVAVFSSFADATMTFELRVYLADIVNGTGVRNELRLAIFERFREEGLAKPFTAEPEVEPEEPIDEAFEAADEEDVPLLRPAEEAAQRSGTKRRPRRIVGLASEPSEG